MAKPRRPAFDAGGQIVADVVFNPPQTRLLQDAAARGCRTLDGLSMLVGGTNSGTSLAMATVAQEKKLPFISIGAGSARLTNEACTPYTVHYAYDTVALAKGTGGAVVKQGGKDWFFLTADYAFGHALETDTANVVKAAGGAVKGTVRAPLNTSDFSSFLLQAQSSGAKILGLANAGGDTIASIKAASEFGITKTMKLAGLLMFVTDIHSLGLKDTQGMYLTDSWYWDKDDASREFAKKFFSKAKSMPTSIHAANYSAVTTYLKAVTAAKTTDSDKVMAQLKSMEISDFFGKGRIRPDGRYVHDMYLLEVKKPAESKQPWDYMKVAATLKGDDVFTTKAESKCALWK